MPFGPATIPPPALTPTILSEYSTPELSDLSSLEKGLVNPLSLLPLYGGYLDQFGADFASYLHKEGSPTYHEKTECPSTVRRMRRREQNRESCVPQTQLNSHGPTNCVQQTTALSGPKRIIYKAA